MTEITDAHFQAEQVTEENSDAELDRQVLLLDELMARAGDLTVAEFVSYFRETYDNIGWDVAGSRAFDVLADFLIFDQMTRGEK